MMPPNQTSALQGFDDFYRSLGTAVHKNFPGNKLLSLADSAAQFERKRQHLLKLYKGVKAVHSFVDDSGQVFDCVPIDQQPALIKSGKPLAQPPSFPGGTSPPKPGSAALVLDGSRTDRHGNKMVCPPGTVPIRRVTLEELSRFDDLDHFLRKGPRSDRRSGAQLLESPDAPGASPPHEYAHAYQSVANSGGHGFLNVWSPTVTGNQIFSLSQHWYVANGASGLQTAEVGWQVYPQKYGHSNPVLFTFWTADGYVNTGSYNNDAGDFVQYSANCPVGVALTATSVSGGNQAEIELSFVFSQGNWWLYVNGTDTAHAVGYYPTSLYQNGPMATGATEIDFGGETVGAGAYPPMGSGAFASVGYSKAAYHRNITYFPPNGGVQDAVLTASQDWPNSYTIDLQKSAEWGQCFFFGGPGSAAPVAAMAAPGAAIVAPAIFARNVPRSVNPPPPQVQMHVINFYGPAVALTSGGVDEALAPTALKQPELWSVLSVETSGCGYLADRRPKILFERHIFSRLTGHQYDADDPDVSQPTAGGYGPSGAYQYDRLNAAMQLDTSAALQSASWGLGQIMGENFQSAGYSSVENMVADMVASEDNHLRAMVNFIGTQGLIGPLMNHDWASFARRYNGPNYAANNYDGLLSHFYAKYSAGSMPDLRVRTAQIYLRYLNYAIGAIDGVQGPATRAAVLAFQAKVPMAQTGDIDDALIGALKSTLGL